MIYLFFRFFTPIRTVYYRFPYIFPLFSHRKGSLTSRADLRFTIDSAVEDFHSLFISPSISYIFDDSVEAKSEEYSCAVASHGFESEYEDSG